MGSNNLASIGGWSVSGKTAPAFHTEGTDDPRGACTQQALYSTVYSHVSDSQYLTGLTVASHGYALLHLYVIYSLNQLKGRSVVYRWAAGDSRLYRLYTQGHTTNKQWG